MTTARGAIIVQSGNIPNRIKCRGAAVQTTREMENPVSRERFRIVLSGEQTGGEVFRLEVSGPPQVVPPPVHRHLYQSERFEVVEGELALLVDGCESQLRAGESTVVPPGAAHTWRNSGPGTARFINEFRPAGAAESFFETFCGLASEGRCDVRGQPPLLQVAASFPLWDMVLAGPPIAAQRLFMGILRPLARARGYRARYPRFESARCPLASTTNDAEPRTPARRPLANL